ncbi:MAG TPA: hypothetical protein DIT48_10775 [Actinobacteria bacterium]|nr:hypothetical protein [Actinomycetota bacterium]
MPNFDERLRRALGRMAAPGDDDPEGRLGDVRSRKHRRAVVRRLQVAALTVAVVAGTIGGTFALAHAFGGTHRTLVPGGVPSSSPTVPVVEPTPTDSPTPSPTPWPWPTNQPPVFTGSACSLNMLTGEFDGDGIPDQAFVFYPQPADGVCPPMHDVNGLAGWLIDISWGSGTSGEWPLPDCASVCNPLGVSDLNGDGTGDMALQVDMGASTSHVQILQLNDDERGPVTYQISGSGLSAGWGFAWSGSVTHQDYITCARASDGKTVLYATSGVLSMPDGSQWTVVERTFSFDPATTVMTQTGEQSTIYPAPSQPSSPPFPVRGDACFPGSNLGAT